jgi:CheY-like chemotaxis protein
MQTDSFDALPAQHPILLVEDNPGDAELSLLALDRLGLQSSVVHARSGAQALDYLFRRGRYASLPPRQTALVFLDLKLPLGDGFSVLREMRAHASLAHTPVVMLTSSNEPSDRQRAYQAGASAYMCKPVDFVEFTEAMRYACKFWVDINQRAPG